MRFLLTSDWQCDWSNLDTCVKAWEQVMAIADEYRVQGIVNAGDLKRVYNPVDVRVTRFWMDATRKATNRGYDVIDVLGNHDRIGQYADDENWFPILRKAGATCVDRPELLYDGALAVLPYCTDKIELRKRADWLAKRSDPQKTILIFHEDLLGCKYNKLGMRSEKGIEPEALHPDRYLQCYGGHIHLRQKVAENISYIGSPFCQDWGEANQRKGFTLVSSEAEEGRFIPSAIPGWFDPTWPGFGKPERGWEGCSVRIHVSCKSGTDFLERTEAARADAETRYEGAEIYVTATFERDRILGENGGFGVSTPDGEKIREYVRQTCPENLNRRVVVEYLTERLEEVGGGLRTGKGVRFIKATAKNFLSFKNVDVKWNQKGITLVQGQNKDRKGKSNGAGKTSVLQTIPVALFGNTFKGQKHDGWARRHAEGKASVDLELADAKGRRIRILRQRKPTRLQLWIDGKDVSTGLNPNDKTATQAEIELVTGFTWHTLANAVYIDQEVARAFLAGTKKERTQVLSKFQNLERFEKALALIRKDKAKDEDRARECERKIAVIEERIRNLNKQLSVLMEETKELIRIGREDVEKKKKAYLKVKEEWQPEVERLGIKEARYLGLLDAERAARADGETQLVVTHHDFVKRKEEAKQLTAALSLSECPFCRQQVDPEKLKNMLNGVRAMIDGLKLKFRALTATKRDLNVRCQELEGAHDQIQIELVTAERYIRNAKLAYTEMEKNYGELVTRAHTQSQAYKDTKFELRMAMAKKDRLDSEYKAIKKDRLFFEYCERSMGRDGIPAFLNALLCPQLNVAADYYAELFGDRALQVRFEIENGEFVPVILNATGGEDIDSQSDGERALAGLIASFALREIAPRCNVLILDEPGNGLDPSTVRQFATSMKRLKEKFESIFVTSHNVHLLQELEGERVVTVQKRNGISSVLED